jgi:hypothetical protein
MRESEMDNACIPTVRPVPFKQEPVDKEPTMGEDIEEYSSDDIGGIPIMQCLPHIMMNVRRSEVRKKLQFDPLPLTVAFQAVPSDDQDDDTLSMDTCDKEKNCLTYTTKRPDFYG